MTDDFAESIRKRMGGSSQITDEDRAAFNEKADRTTGSIFGTLKGSMEDLGWERIATDTDASRAVARRGDVVVKFDYIGDPWRNTNEQRNWETALPASAKHLFARVIETAEDDEWLVMEAADTDAVTPAAHRGLLRELIVEHNLDMTDPHPDNVGMLDGRAVMIDYNFQPREVADSREERIAAYEKKLRDYDIEP